MAKNRFTEVLVFQKEEVSIQMNVTLYGVWVLKELLLSIYFRLLAACRLEESPPLVLSSSRLWERTAVLPTCGKLISTDLADML